MTALKWARLGCRVVALALAAWVVLTGLPQFLAMADRLEVSVVLRPVTMPTVIQPRRA
jgi:hypothetical protein